MWRMMMMMIVVFFLAGCAPAIKRTKLLDLPPMPFYKEVNIYSTQLPPCPYKEVGHLTLRRRSKTFSVADMVELMRRETLSMGGDAIIHFRSGEHLKSVIWTRNIAIPVKKDVISGTVVLILDDQCIRATFPPMPLRSDQSLPMHLQPRLTQKHYIHGP